MHPIGNRVAYNYPTMERSERERGVGLCLLPIELLQEIFSQLALPELLRLRAACRALQSLPLLPGELHGAGGSWLFLFKKRSPRDAVLRGFNDRAGRWFLFPLAHIFSSAAAGDDLYLLAAAGDFFLFASNARRELIAADLRSGAARRLPASPLGPRGTSSWRRPGLKLLSSRSSHFRFVFAEMTQTGPILFEYTSETDAWKTWVPSSSSSSPPYEAVLSANHQGVESVLVAAPPVVLRPRFPVGAGDGMRVYGDGHLALIRSAAAAEEAQRLRVRKVVGIEIWGVCSDGGWWEKIAGAPPELMETVGGRSFSVMTGCLEVAGDIVRLVLMANYKGTWDLTWVTFDKGNASWGVVPVPDCGAKGFNMAGMAFTSFLGLWPAAPPKGTAALACL